LALFGKKKDKEPVETETPEADRGASTAGPTDVQSFEGDPRKARKFFDHAETVAEAKNFDYAIEMYINGLRQDPDNMARHEQLLEVAKRRKVAGGKKAGLKDKLTSSGSDPVSKMLDAEKIWAMDFGDPALMREFMKRAVEADEAYDNLNLGEVAFWIGSMALDIPGLKPRVKDFVQLRDLFARIGRFDKAVEACKKALRLDMNNQTLLSELKNLEAEQYSAKNVENTQDDGFRGNIKDEAFASESQQGNTRAVSAVDAAIAKRKGEYEEDPEDLDRLGKLVDALLKKEAYDEEEQAMKLLALAHEQSGQYRYKVRAGDIKMKQYNRELRDLKKNLEVAPEDEYFQGRLKETIEEKQNFELGEYQERLKNYPTDLKLKYELGKRMYAADLVDEAIGLLQDAKREPKSKGQATLLLGRAFMDKGWTDEAIDTLAEGIQNHPLPDDALGKELRYEKLKALLASAEKTRKLDQAEEANGLASELLQMDINYKDIKQKKQAASKLLDGLRG
jgi:hypothetical protein